MKNAATKEKNTRSSVFDIEAYSRSQSSSESHEQGYGRGTTRRRTRGKREKVTNNRTLMRLQRIGETNDNNTTISKLSHGSSVNEDVKTDSQRNSFNKYHNDVIRTMTKLKDEIGDDISDSDSDSSLTNDDNDNYSAGSTKNAPTKISHADDA